MDSDQASLELLSHFDRPKQLTSAELRIVSQPPTSPGVCETVESSPPQEPPAEPGAAERVVDEHLRQILRRDVRWILKWAAALAVIAIAASQLTAFAFVWHGERQLELAARAGASESILPRATYATISAALERRLASYPQLRHYLQQTVLQNGRPVGPRFQAGEDDRISVTVSAPASAFLPGWLTHLPTWRSEVLITARAERTMPSHKLRPEHSHTAAE